MFKKDRLALKVKNFKNKESRDKNCQCRSDMFQNFKAQKTNFRISKAT